MVPITSSNKIIEHYVINWTISKPNERYNVVVNVSNEKIGCMERHMGRQTSRCNKMRVITEQSRIGTN